MSSVTSKAFAWKHISTVIEVSHEALLAILSGINLQVSSNLSMPTHEGVTVELRALQVTSRANPMRKYLIVFVFSKEKANRLLVIDEAITKMVVDNLELCGALRPLSRHPWTGTTLMLVGKTGSKELTKFYCLTTPHKVVHFDFSGKTSVEQFVTMILSDIDKVEQKGSLTKTDEIDLSALPMSEKRIRLTDDMSVQMRRETVFVNQLLQVPGISENVAQSLAIHFKRPSELIAKMESQNSLDEFSFTSAKGEKKKLNVRIKSTLYRLCSQGVSHDEFIR